MRTKVTDLLGIQHPILQGSMANIATGKFAAAVSETGALGIISGGGKSVEGLRQEIRACNALTSKPFGVNIVLQPKESVPGMIDMLIQEQVKIVITSAGNPQPWIPLMKEAGITVICVIAAPKQAQKAEKAGAHALIAEGSESGGHIGDAHTLPLVAAVTACVSIPVIAAGGFADGRGLAAAIMLGADAIQCGTAFLATDECPVSETYKVKILEADITDTLVTGRTTNDVVRSLRSPLSEAMYKLELTAGDPAKLIEMGTGSLRRAVGNGDWETGSFQVGQTAGLIHECVSCKALVEQIMLEANVCFHERSNYWCESSV